MSYNQLDYKAVGYYYADRVQNGGRPPSWKIEKRSYLANGFTDLHENWHSDAQWPSEQYWQLKRRTLKNPRMRTAFILIIVESLYLSNGSTCCREFGTPWPY